MAEVIVVKGAVTYSITIDPSVWVFDERKIDLATYAGEDETDDDLLEAYLRNTAAHWEKELREGASPPSERKSLVEERKVLEGDFGIRLAPFLENARPLPDATQIRIHRETGEPIELPLAEAKKAILQFAKGGKPIRAGGPVLFYLPDDLKHNRQPIDRITAFELF